MRGGSRLPEDSGERLLAAKKKAMRLLEQADRSEAGLRDRLLGSGFSEEEAEAALSYVRSFGYLNDQRMAENLIRQALSSQSKQKILMRLTEKGIDRETALLAWEEVTSEEEYSEEDLIRQAVRKRCPGGVPEDPGERRRLYGFLARRGFSYSSIQRALSLPEE